MCVCVCVCVCVHLFEHTNVCLYIRLGVKYFLKYLNTNTNTS